MNATRPLSIVSFVVVLLVIAWAFDTVLPNESSNFQVAAVASSIPAGYVRATSPYMTKDVVPANDQDARFTWWESYTQMGLINYFRASKNVAFLDELIRRIDLVIVARDDKRNYGTKGPVWSSTRYTAGVPYPTLVSTGMITRPMAEIASIIKADSALAAGAAPGGRTYGQVADTYITAAAQAVAFHEKEWRSDLSPARYVALPETSGYLRDSQGRAMSDAYALPYNMEDSIGRTMMYLYQATGNTAYRDRATLLARNLSSAQYIADGGALVWKYWGWSEDPSVEDTSHAWISIDFMRMMYQSGLYFNEAKMTALLRTFHQNIAPSSSTVNNGIDGTSPISGEETEFGAMWAVLSPLDTTVAEKARQIASGTVLTTWRYMVRSLTALDAARKSDGASCRLDTECKSNICFAGKVCGARLGTGSTCTRDVECGSSACTSGKCVAQLAYGESCTRDTQCSSKICFSGRVCGDPLSVTSSCTRDIECSSGVCASGKCAATRSVASSPISAAAQKPIVSPVNPSVTPPAPPAVTVPAQTQPTSMTNLSYGVKCSADTQCSSSICFAGKVCGNILGNGSTCTRNLECVSNRCSSGICADAVSASPPVTSSPAPAPAAAVTNLSYGASCTSDSQCVSAICYAGKTCGNILGYGSTCTRDKECSSGICYAGKVCGNPLGTGSSCTRSSECASSVCSSGSCQ